MTSNVSSISNWTRQGTVSVAGSQTFSPGVYQNISITGSANVTFNPGVYIFVPSAVGDGLNITGSPTVSGSGCMFYFAGSDYLSNSPGYYDNADGQPDVENSDGVQNAWTYASQAAQDGITAGLQQFTPAWNKAFSSGAFAAFQPEMPAERCFTLV